MCAFTGQLTFVGCEDCCDDVTTLEKKLHGYRKGYERLKEELAQKDTAFATFRRLMADLTNVRDKFDDHLKAERDEARAEVAKLKEELVAVRKSNRMNYDLGEVNYEHAKELKTENAKLVAENAKLKVKVEDLTLDVDEGRVLLARSHARNRKLEEQLRVKSVGVPFAEPEPAKPDQHWCEVGEHHVNKEDMWPNFGDCQECCTEDEYLEHCTEADYRKYTSQ